MENERRLSMEEIIKANNLTKNYGDFTALKDINITIKKGDIYGLVGNNGAGKTTLLRILTGQSRPTTGSFELFGKSGDKELSRARRRTGAIIEEPCFYPKLTVAKNMEYYRIQRGIPGKDSVDRALKSVNILQAKNKKFKDLSLGMKQRVGLALAMMGEPELLILDEPINGLDPSGIIEIRKLLLKLNKEDNVTIIISSHILSELSNIATCYGFLNKGILVEQLTAEELEDKCTSYLEIKVDNPKMLCAIIEEKLGYKNYKVMPGNIIHLFEGIKDPEKVSRLAFENDIALKEIRQKMINLEDYYMSLVGGNDNE